MSLLHLGDWSAPIIRFTVFITLFAASAATHATEGDGGYRGPEFVDAESLPEAYRNATYSIVDGLNNRDLEVLKKFYDFEKVALKAGKGLFDSDRAYRGFVEGIKQSKNNVLLALVKQIETTEADIIVTGFVKRTKGVMPQIRIDMGEYGLDYFEYQLEKKDDGSYQVVDWYQLSTGRMFSQSIGIISRVLIDPNPGILRKLLGISEFDHVNIDVIKAIGEARRSSDYVEANRLFSSLSPEIKNTRIFLELGIGLASLIQDDALYKSRLKLLADNHGADPSAAFLLIDHYFYLGNAEKALENIEVMERKIGRDGYTTYLKANIYAEVAGDFSNAKALYWEAIDIEPGLEDPYHSLAYIYILEGDFANGVEVYKLLENNFNVQYATTDFYDTPEVSPFKESAEFRQWMKSR